jgi:hypothetical protein
MYRFKLQGVDYPHGPGRTSIHLNLPETPQPAKSIKSLEGELHIADAIVDEIAFTGAELKKPTEKTSGSTLAKLSKVTQTPKGIDAKLLIDSTKKEKPFNPFAHGGQMQDPAEQLKKMMKQTAPGRVTVVLVDSEGNVHAPKSTSGNSSSSNQGSFNNGNPNNGTSGTFSSKSGGGSSSGSFSGGGGGGGGGSWGGSSGGNGGNGGSFSSEDEGNSQSAEKPAGKRHGKKSAGGAADSAPGAVFHFDPLPEGVTIQSIECTVIDLNGDPKPVPFRLENIPLP